MQHCTGTTSVRHAVVALAALLAVTACGGKQADPAPAPSTAAAGDSAATADSTASGSRRPASDQVPVGYGTQDRRELAVSVATLSAEEVDRFRVTRVEELLRGRVAGVEVSRTSNGDLSVRIRGAGNFQGGGEPLWVLDGMPLPQGLGLSSLASISPQDVERIDVLKDAGSTAIYGSQGAHGVILIRTKRHR